MDDHLEKPVNQAAYVVFKLNDLSYAFSGRNVVEVAEVPNMNKIPGAPDYIRGLIQYKQKTLPVIDLRLKLSNEKTNYTVNTCLIVYLEQIYDKVFYTAFLVDAIEEVINLPYEQNFESSYNEDGGNYIFMNSNRKCFLIEVSSLFSVEEVAYISDLNQL